MASSLRVNAIVPASGTNVAIGTAGGTITYNANVTGVSTFTSLSLGTGTSISSPATNVLALGTNNTEAVRINSVGNIGIGTTNALTKFHICYSNASDTSGGALTLDDVNRNGVIYVPGQGASQGIYYFRRGTPSSYTDQLVVDANGNVRKPLQSFCDTGDTTSYGAAGSLVSSPGSAKGNWSSTVTNVGNNFSTSTDLYTCPSAGAYAVSCTCSIDNLTPAPYRTIFVLSFNGGYEEITELFDTYENQSPCVIRYCNVNDTIGLGINGTGGSSYHVRLQVYFLG